MEEKKKKTAKAAIVIIGMIAFLVGVFCLGRGVFVKENPILTPFTKEIEEKAKELDRTIIQALFNPEKKEMAVEQTLKVKNPSQKKLNEVILRTYANAFYLQETSPAAIEEIFDESYYEGFVPGGLAFEEVKVNGSRVSYTFEDQGKTVMNLSLDHPWAINEEIEIALKYKIIIPSLAYSFGYVKEVYQLGNVFPFMAVYEEEAWRKEEYFPIGNPVYNNYGNYEVSLTLPKEYQVGASSAGNKTLKEEKVTYTYQALAQRGFAFTISKAFIKQEKKVGNVLLTTYSKNKVFGEKLLKYGEKALLFFEEEYGKYPYQQLTVSEGNFPFGEKVYPGLIIVDGSNHLEDQELEWRVVRAIAHQWWGMIVGTDPYYQPWQDEALCEYALLSYIGKTYGKDAKENMINVNMITAMRVTIPRGVTPGSPVHYFNDLKEYYLVVAQRGGMLFLMLEEALGEEGLQIFLKAYYNEYAFTLVTRQEMEQLLVKVTGQNWQGLFTDFLDTQYTY